MRGILKTRPKQKRRPPASGAPPSPPAVPAANQKPLRPRHRWLFRVLAILLVPLLLLGGLELVLRMAGYGYNPDYFLPLRIRTEDYLVQNEEFSRRFFPGDVSRQPAAIRMKAQKTPGALRVFVLGESAAMGDPEPAFGPARHLEILLRERHPDREVEIVNVAFTAINSHVILPIARECARHEGDVWIVYMGNNEMVGPFGAATVFGAKSPPLGYVRLSLALQRTRIGQWGRSLAQRWQKSATPAASWQGMQMFMENRVPPDSPSRQAAYRNFAGNLDDIIRAGVAHGARVILNTVAVNLRESPPFAAWPSEHLSPPERSRFENLLAQARQATANENWTDAVEHSRQAVALDATHAEAHYQLAAALERAGDMTAARQHYQLACDADALPFRADTPINEAIRRAAHAGGSQVTLLEAAEAMASHGGRTPPGNESFYEHVHFNFDGAYRLGLAWAQAVEQALPAGWTAPPAADWPTQERCEALLGLTAWNRKLILESMVRRLEQPPLSTQSNNSERRQALRTQERNLLAAMTPAAVTNAGQLYADIIAAHPDDHFLREARASFLQLTGDLPGAVREWQAVSQLLPHDFLPWFQLGVMQSRQGRHAEAQTNLRRAIAIRPVLVEGWLELGRSLAAERKWEPSAAAFQRAGELRPQDPLPWMGRGKAAAELGRWPEAIGHYQQAIALRPDYVEARVALAVLLGQAGRIPEALAQCDAAIKLKPDHAAARFNRGVLLLEQNRRDAAIEEFQTVLRLEPAHQAAAEYLAHARNLGERKP